MSNVSHPVNSLPAGWPIILYPMNDRDTFIYHKSEDGYIPSAGTLVTLQGYATKAGLVHRSKSIQEAINKKLIYALPFPVSGTTGFYLVKELEPSTIITIKPSNKEVGAVRVPLGVKENRTYINQLGLTTFVYTVRDTPGFAAAMKDFILKVCLTPTTVAAKPTRLVYDYVDATTLAKRSSIVPTQPQETAPELEVAVKPTGIFAQQSTVATLCLDLEDSDD